MGKGSNNAAVDSSSSSSQRPPHLSQHVLQLPLPERRYNSTPAPSRSVLTSYRHSGLEQWIDTWNLHFAGSFSTESSHSHFYHFSLYEAAARFVLWAIDAITRLLFYVFIPIFTSHKLGRELEQRTVGADNSNFFFNNENKTNANDKDLVNHTMHKFKKSLLLDYITRLVRYVMFCIKSEDWALYCTAPLASQEQWIKFKVPLIWWLAQVPLVRNALHAVRISFHVFLCFFFWLILIPNIAMLTLFNRFWIFFCRFFTYPSIKITHANPLSGQELFLFNDPYMTIVAFAYTEQTTASRFRPGVFKRLVVPAERKRKDWETRGCRDRFATTDGTDRLHSTVQQLEDRGHYWVWDNKIDMNYHVTKYHPIESDLTDRKTGDKKSRRIRLDKMEDICSMLASKPLDPAHPLWQFTIVEKAVYPTTSETCVQCEPREGSIILLRCHHCLTDGIALMDLFMNCIMDGYSDDACTPSTPVSPITPSTTAYSSPEANVLLAAGNHLFSANKFLNPNSSSPGITLPHQTTRSLVPPEKTSCHRLRDKVALITSSCLAAPAFLWHLLFLRPERHWDDYKQIRPDVSRQQRVTFPFELSLNDVRKVRLAMQEPIWERGAKKLQGKSTLLGSMLQTLSVGLRWMVGWNQIGQRCDDAGQKVRFPKKVTVNDVLVSVLVGGYTRYMDFMTRRQHERPHSWCNGNDPFCLARDDNRWALESTAETMTGCLSPPSASTIASSPTNRSTTSEGELTIERDAEELSSDVRYCQQTLNILLPVNLRTRNETRETRKEDKQRIKLANSFSGCIIEVPTSRRSRTAAERLKDVCTCLWRFKTENKIFFSGLFEKIMYSWWPDLMDLIFKHQSRSVSMVFSNVAGPEHLSTCNGVKVYDLSFVVPSPHQIGVGISALSYEGKIHITVASDRNCLSQPELLKRFILEEAKQLVHLSDDLTTKGSARVRVSGRNEQPSTVP